MSLHYGEIVDICLLKWSTLTNYFSADFYQLESESDTLLLVTVNFYFTPLVNKFPIVQCLLIGVIVAVVVVDIKQKDKKKTARKETDRNQMIRTNKQRDKERTS